MKGKDIALLGGGALALYLLLSKKTAAPVSGSGPSILGFPSGGGTDIGGIIAGMGSMFSGIMGAMPGQMIPELNIPEFVMPNIDIPDLPDWEGLIPDWENFLPDWEKFLPDIPDELNFPDIPSLIPDIPDLLPSIPSLFGGNGNGAMMSFFPEVTKVWDNFWHSATDIVAWGNRPWYKLFTDPLWTEKPTDESETMRAESEAIFEEAGFSEVTPGNIDVFLAARDKVTGVEAEELPPIGSEAYMLRMLGNPLPWRGQ